MSETTSKPVYSINDVAAILGRSRRTIIRMFEDEPGVVDLAPPQGNGKRRYRSLGIPRAVLGRVLSRRTLGGVIAIKYSRRKRK
jgi:hypothetical protein